MAGQEHPGGEQTFKGPGLCRQLLTLHVVGAEVIREYGVGRRARLRLLL